MPHLATHSQKIPLRTAQCVARRQRVNVVARAIAPDVAAEPAPGPGEEPLSFEPGELVLEPGEMSPMNRKPAEEAFRCTGCTDAACQGPSGCNKTAWRFEESGYLRAVLTARVYEVAVRLCTATKLKETPLELATLLSKRLDNSIWLKREDMQPVFSFKLRGAFNKMASLPKDRLEQGVICSSAGNHAQGVALAAQRLGTSAVICMPMNTPEIKVDAVRALGGEVRLIGESYTETQAYAWQAAEEEQRSFIAPYDDPLTIAGQGTAGAEILKQLGQNVQDLHAIFVPIGGGGLIAGIAAYVKALRPDISIIGVEPVGANCMALSLREGRRVTLSKVDAFADGVAVKSVGLETFRLCQKHLDGVVLVDNASISAAIKDMFTETRTIVEPAGALAIAGAKAYLSWNNMKGKAVVAVTSGANMNFDRLRLVADLANFGSQTEAMLVISIPESPGEFLTFIDTVLNSEDGSKITVSEFKYRYSVDRPAKILFSLSTESPKVIESAVQRLVNAGYQCQNVTDSGAAQLHLRHMVGGRPRSYTGSIDHEKMVVVNFPEKAGALRQFLGAMCPAFNVTMFHYRATGNRSSSVLLGLQVPPAREGHFQDLVEKLRPLDFTFEKLDGKTQAVFDEFIS